MARIGIYGGSFDPPHIGHLMAAEYFAQAVQPDQLLWMPCYQSPGREADTYCAEPQQRLQMLTLMTEHKPAWQVCPWEIHRAETSFTALTLERMRAEYPNDQLYLCVGTDTFLKVHQWRSAENFLPGLHLTVLRRSKKEDENALQEQQLRLTQMGAEVTLLDNPVVDISSTDIRRMLAFQCAGEHLVPKVEDYIRQNGLYGTDQDLRGLPMEQLEQVVTSLVKKNRVRHILGCRDTAVQMAKRWGANEEAAARAGLLHDITKALDGPLQLTLCRSYDILLDEFSIQNPKTLHAMTGALVAQRIFGESEEVVSAICSHTTGKANMNTLEKIIYVADYMEPNRSFDGVERLRELAFSDLDGALKLGLEMTLAVLKSEGKTIASQSQEALAYLNRRPIP